jgi:hypothetical protein
MVVIAISLVVCILGLILYLLTCPPAPAPRTKWATIGEHMFWVGLLVFLLRWTPTGVIGIK